MLKYVPHVDFQQRMPEVLEDVYSGQLAVIEQPGKPKAILIDFIDYLIMQAVMRYHTQPMNIEPQDGLSSQSVFSLSSIPDRYNIVIQHYLAQAISLGRAAELLDLSWFELRMRCQNLSLPQYVGPTSMDEIQSDIDVALKLEGNHLLKNIIDAGYRSPISSLDKLIRQ